MSDKDTILEGVIQTLAKCMDLPIEEIKPDSTLVADLGLDSLDVVELVMALEEDFACEIPDEESDSIQDITVQDLAEIVARHMDKVTQP